MAQEPKTPRIDPKVMDTVEEALNGTCASLSEIAEQHGVDENDLLLEIGERGNIERCAKCDWWDEASDMEDMGGELVCSDCRDE